MKEENESQPKQSGSRLRRFLRALFRPGLFALLGVLLPIVFIPISNAAFRSYRQRIQYDDEFRKLFFWFMETPAIVGLLAAVLALRVVFRNRKADESWRTTNRILAVAALVIFALSAFNMRIGMMYGSILPNLEPRHSKIHDYEPNPLEQVNYRFLEYVQERPDALYPCLSGGAKQSHRILDLNETEYAFPEEGLPFSLQYDSKDYFYPGYLLRDAAGLEAYAQVFEEALADSLSTLPQRLEAAGFQRVGRYPLASSVPGLPLPASAWASVPLLIEQIDPDTAREGAVLYADGHVAVLKYPGPWPMTESTMTRLTALANAARAAGGKE